MNSKEMLDSSEAQPGPQGRLAALVMPAVVGRLRYDVYVTCPHCAQQLNLTEYPYDDDRTDYCLDEDELGAATFGGVNNPAVWNGLEIDYTCCKCMKMFRLTDLEI